MRTDWALILFFAEWVVLRFHFWVFIWGCPWSRQVGINANTWIVVGAGIVGWEYWRSGVLIFIDFKEISKLFHRDFFAGLEVFVDVFNDDPAYILI